MFLICNNYFIIFEENYIINSRVLWFVLLFGGGILEGGGVGIFVVVVVEVVVFIFMIIIE